MESAWCANGYVYLLLVISVLLFVLVALTWKRRRAPGSRYLAYVLAAAGMWALVYSVQLGYKDLEKILFWAKLRYVFIAQVSVFWFLFSYSFSHGRKKSPLCQKVLLSIVPVFINLLIWSPWESLFMSAVGTVPRETAVFIDFSYGPIFWIYSFYSYALIGGGSVVMTHTLWVKRAVYRGQLGMLAIGILAPWIGNVLSIFELLPNPQFDVTPFALLISGVAMLLGLYRFQLLDLLPVAQETIFRNMSDGMIVLDAEMRITDTNPPVQRILGLDQGLKSGQYFNSLLPELAESIEFSEKETSWREEIMVSVNGSRRDIEVQVTRLAMQGGAANGWLIGLHDISVLKQSAAVLQDRARQISILNEISLSANRLEGVEQLLPKLAEKLQLLMNADSCMVIRTRVRHGSPMIVRVEEGKIRVEGAGILTDVEADMAEAVIESGGMVVVQDGFVSKGRVEHVPGRRRQTILASPMCSASETLGVIMASFNGAIPFDEELCTLFENAVEQIALALARVVLLEELEVRVDKRTAALEQANQELEEEISQRIYYEQELSVKARDLEMNQLDIIWRLANAGEFRDNETGNHVVRVGYYSWIIAREFGLDDDSCRMIFLTSPLHDIGKIGIPDEILMKTTSLTESERIQMKDHCLIGANILMSNPAVMVPIQLSGQELPVEVREMHVCNPFIEMAASIALSHHERWDGKGYPMEIEGVNIPIEARIVAVADVFDALMSRRRYKQAFPLDRSISEVERGAGTQFDPAVVKAFSRVADDLGEIHKKFGD